MDVITVSGPTSTGGSGTPQPPVTRATEAANERSANLGHIVDALGLVTRNRQSEPVVRPEGRPEGAKVWTTDLEAGKPTEALKFDVASADVLARFWIDEQSNRVVVTMYDRGTGEVIMQSPPRAVLDVVAVLEGCGLVVDTST